MAVQPNRSYVGIGELQVDEVLYQFVEADVLPGLPVTSAQFWDGFASLLHDLTPKNRQLLEKRAQLQQLIDLWHMEHRTFNPGEYAKFLKTIGYLEDAVADFEIETTNVDDEIACLAGPQLVVPIDNARYAINAINARYGSLYDALYGTDAIHEDEGLARTASYNPIRGAEVVLQAKRFLDLIAPLAGEDETVVSHTDVIQYTVTNGHLCVKLQQGGTARLQTPSKFVGFQGEARHPSAILLQNHGLHVEIQVDKQHPVGQRCPAGIRDIVMESAVTTILDFEDSISAVDADDKTHIYRNWLRITQGTISATFEKGGRTVTRTMNPDRTYVSPDGGTFSVPGRARILVRNVGHLMTTDAVLDANGEAIPEGILDGVMTALIGMHGFPESASSNTQTQANIYIVKPKMHGSDEVAFANTLFNRIEALLGLSRNTLKIGVMDEERRTSLNLKNCIHAVRERIVFINTGFLDRTGDEIHTSMRMGPMIRKNEMKTARWLQAYEASNVDIGLGCGLPGRAQIGKGMWAMPDRMNDMIQQKVAHPKAGASTAWVPSPTAATLHALHYHQVDVRQAQVERKQHLENHISGLLEIPIEPNPAHWRNEDIQAELNNNVQSILGYVVRWITLGIGCSKVPDIHQIGLMEDRATLRISSQHIGNWLMHGICSREQVIQTMQRMAEVVDAQNANTDGYVPMTQDGENSVAFQAAMDLIFQAHEQPNGYTEPILHHYRRVYKASLTPVGQGAD